MPFSSDLWHGLQKKYPYFTDFPVNPCQNKKTENHPNQAPLADK